MPRQRRHRRCRELRRPILLAPEGIAHKAKDDAATSERNFIGKIKTLVFKSIIFPTTDLVFEVHFFVQRTDIFILLRKTFHTYGRLLHLVKNISCLVIWLGSGQSRLDRQPRDSRGIHPGKSKMRNQDTLIRRGWPCFSPAEQSCPRPPP